MSAKATRMAAPWILMRICVNIMIAEKNMPEFLLMIRQPGWDSLCWLVGGKEIP